MPMKNRQIYFDKDGKPIDLMTWAKLLENREYAGIATDKTPAEFFGISTVWFGIDHMLRDSPATPMIFETMVVNFTSQKAIEGGNHTQVLPEIVEIIRTSTEADAVKEHAQQLQKYTNIEAENKNIIEKLQK